MQYDDIGLKTNYERLAQLGSRVAEMYRIGASTTALGGAALELLTLRNRFEEHKKKMKPKELESVNKSLQELEKSIISLYMLSVMNEKRTHRIQDYMFNDYTIFER